MLRDGFGMRDHFSFGKPHAVQFEYAGNVLVSQAARVAAEVAESPQSDVLEECFDQVFMVCHRFLSIEVNCDKTVMADWGQSRC